MSKRLLAVTSCVGTLILLGCSHDSPCADCESPSGETSSSASSGNPSSGAGGSTSSVGSGGTVVQACDALPAKGTWTRITPPNVSFSGAIAVDPHKAGRLWVGAQGEGLYRSDDCGASWAHINTGQNGAQLDPGGQNGTIISMVVDPTDSDVVYVASYGSPRNIWKSTDAGVSWKPLLSASSEIGKALPSLWFQSIALDPTDNKHLVAASHDTCAAPYDLGCQIESTDGGDTWTIVKNPEGAGWAENGGALVLGSTTWIYGQPFGKLWLTQDHGAHWKDVTPAGGNGTSGGFSAIPVRASDNHFYLPSLWGMMRSPDGLTWEALPGLAGRFVGMVISKDRIIAADQWANTFRTTTVDDLSKWTEIPPPAELPSDAGAPFLAYDEAHHLLYASAFAGGVWRVGM
jgi:hypothetical protein